MRLQTEMQCNAVAERLDVIKLIVKCRHRCWVLHIVIYLPNHNARVLEEILNKYLVIIIRQRFIYGLIWIQHISY